MSYKAVENYGFSHSHSTIWDPESDDRNQNHSEYYLRALDVEDCESGFIIFNCPERGGSATELGIDGFGVQYDVIEMGHHALNCSV